jgi:hypothetical protein
MSKTDNNSSETISNAKLEAGPIDEGILPAADANVVDWDGPDDTANPHNWPPRKRWSHVVMVALLALVTYVSKMFPLPFPTWHIQSRAHSRTPSCYTDTDRHRRFDMATPSIDYGLLANTELFNVGTWAQPFAHLRSTI